jgi:hypothetical protein
MWIALATPTARRNVGSTCVGILIFVPVAAITANVAMIDRRTMMTGSTTPVIRRNRTTSSKQMMRIPIMRNLGRSFSIRPLTSTEMTGDPVTSVLKPGPS